MQATATCWWSVATWAAYMGLQILEREKTVFQAAPTAQPELEDFAYCWSVNSSRKRV